MTNTTKSAATTGQRCRAYVQERLPFHNSNRQLYGRNERGLYVVYSYGEHWPLFIYDGAQWLENKERASVTTSKHRSQAHPLQTTTLATCAEMRAIINAAWKRRAA